MGKTGKRKVSNEESERKSTRQATAELSTNTVLADICIFCSKASKYKKGISTRESLRCCSEMRVDDRIREAATEKHDLKVMSIASDELVAKEAKYHPSCYRDYTRPKKELACTSDTLKIDIMKSILKKLLERSKGHIVPLSEVKKSVADEFQRQNIKEESYLKNLKRSILRQVEDVKILETSFGDMLIYRTASVEDFVELYLIQQEQLEKIETLNKNIVSAARLIRAEIKESQYKMTWPPLVSDLDMNNFPALPMLEQFLQILILNDVGSKISNKSIQSIAQDIFYAVFKGKKLTPKSIAVPMMVKSLTNNTEIVTTLNRLGHGISYSKLLETTTEVAYSQVSSRRTDDGLYLPENCNREKFTILVEDNIDRNEETLTGHGTTHKVNSIIIQGGHFKPTISDDLMLKEQSEELNKTKRRSFKYTKPRIQEYLYSKRQGPKVPMKMVLNEGHDLMFADQKDMNLAWLLSRRSPSAMSIPSWTGYHIKLRSHLPVKKNVIGYLDCLDAPATEMSTIYHMMNRAIKIKESLGIERLVCVYDQAIYAKAIEIQLKEPEKFCSLFLMMGTFHIIMMFLGIIGTRFKDAGLKDIYIQSGIVAEGSIDSVFRGKQYNRGLRAHKIFMEALWCLLLERFEAEKAVNGGYLETVSNIDLENLVSSNEFIDYKEKLCDFQENLCHDSQLFCFWNSFLTMMENLLSILYATRTGDWILYVESIRLVLPWVFAYDRQNYSRYLSLHFMELVNLKENHKYIYDEFMNGNFAVQLSDNNPFGKQEADKVIETTINKDTKTPGGTTGFSTNQSAVHRWTITASYRSMTRHLLHQFIKFDSDENSHKDLQPSRINKDLKDVEKVLEVVKETLINPLEEKQLIGLSNGILPNEKIKNDLLFAYERGKSSFDAFVQERLVDLSKTIYEPIKKLRLETFSSKRKKTAVQVKGREVQFSVQSAIFGKVALISQVRSINLKEMFSFPLGTVPYALSDELGRMIKTNKSDLLSELEKDVTFVDKIPSSSCSIIDGMALVRKVKCSGLTFLQISDHVFNAAIATSKGSKRIDIVFDVYFEMSIKNVERNRRCSEPLRMKSIVGNNVVRQWSSFLGNGNNKNEMVNFFVKEWMQKEIPENLLIFVTRGDKCICLNDKKEMLELRSAHEEADTRMFLHVVNASAEGYRDIILHTPDTDVIIIALGFFGRITSEIFIKTGVKEKIRIISISRIVHQLQRNYEFDVNDISGVIGFHAFTGCDTVSAFWRKGKRRPFNLMMKNMAFLKIFSELGLNWEMEDINTISTYEEFVCAMYGSKTFKSVNALRYQMYCDANGKIDARCLPPCQDSLHQHLKRANYQSAIWRRSMQNDLHAPSPIGKGWIRSSSEELEIFWLSLQPAPEEVLDLLSCHCSGSCRESSCPCIANKLSCTDACHGFECLNTPAEQEIDESDSESDDESDIDSDVES